MFDIRIRDVKKALRILGWVLVKVDGNKSFYRHPDVPDGLSIVGLGYEVVSSEILVLVELRLGQCFRPVLA